MRQKQIPPFGVRMQPDLKRKVEESAHRNGRSMNSEIVYQLTKLYFPERFKEGEAA
ncbi:Arc family DNA-binding protein [Marinobacterium jannaschii]|uniref:Arc family DNA-binding protein n=1 Tax=Marinobacterium jannaschii TaxID=64970 RepID=UPI0009FE10A5|nr:Arc family DNA-binding protein [Marinobacterium jannaschii]